MNISSNNKNLRAIHNNVERYRSSVFLRIYPLGVTFIDNFEIKEIDIRLEFSVL